MGRWLMVSDLPLLARGITIFIAVIYLGLSVFAPSIVQGSWVAWVIAGMVLAVVDSAFALRKS